MVELLSTSAKKTIDSNSSCDKTVKEQLAERHTLKHQLDVSCRIYITGPGGLCHHAHGSFQDGMFNPDSHGVLWDVGLEMIHDMCERFK